MNVKLEWIEFGNVPSLFELLLTFHTRRECGGYKMENEVRKIAFRYVNQI